MSPDAYQLLSTWGLRISGQRFRSVGIWGAGGRSGKEASEDGVDEALVIVRYIESTEGFEKAKAVLKWVYVFGRPIQEFRVATPGHGHIASLYHRGWGMFSNLKHERVAPAVHDEFLGFLVARMQTDPYHQDFQKTG